MYFKVYLELSHVNFARHMLPEVEFRKNDSNLNPTLDNSHLAVPRKK